MCRAETYEAFSSWNRKRKHIIWLGAYCHSFLVILLSMMHMMDGWGSWCVIVSCTLTPVFISQSSRSRLGHSSDYPQSLNIIDVRVPQSNQRPLSLISPKSHPLFQQTKYTLRPSQLYKVWQRFREMGPSLPYAFIDCVELRVL